LEFGNFIPKNESWDSGRNFWPKFRIKLKLDKNGSLRFQFGWKRFGNKWTEQHFSTLGKDPLSTFTLQRIFWEIFHFCKEFLRNLSLPAADSIKRTMENWENNTCSSISRRRQKDTRESHEKQKISTVKAEVKRSLLLIEISTGTLFFYRTLWCNGSKGVKLLQFSGTDLCKN